MKYMPLFSRWSLLTAFYLHIVQRLFLLDASEISQVPTFLILERFSLHIDSEVSTEHEAIRASCSFLLHICMVESRRIKHQHYYPLAEQCIYKLLVDWAMKYICN